MSEMNQWKNKFQEMMQVCQGELKKTAEIGKKMITASQSSASLEKKYIKLGALVCSSIENGDLEWSNDKAKSLIEEINKLKAQLESIESEVQDIKKES